MKAAVQHAVRIEPRKIVAADAIDCGEPAPDDHLAIALHRDRKDVAVGIGGAGSRKSVLKATVHAAVGIDPRNGVAGHTVDRREATPDEHLAIALDRDRGNDAWRLFRASYPGKSILKLAVQRAVCVQPGNIGATDTIDHGEFAPDQHLPVALHRDGRDARNRIDVGIDAAAGPGKSVLKAAV